MSSTTIKGKDIKAGTDVYGYDIAPDTEYVVDHINSSGLPEYVTVEAWDNSHAPKTIGKYRLIEQDSFVGLYNFEIDEMIVELADGTRVYLVEGYGGEQSVIGGSYRWPQGAAYKIRPKDTLESLHGGSEDYERMINGYDAERPVLNWPGSMISVVARGAVAAQHAAH